MLDRTITGALLIVGIIHLLPMTGYLGASKLSALYNITIDDPNLEILMRHRAVLFGVLGSLFIYAAFQPNVHAPPSLQFGNALKYIRQRAT